MSDDTVDVDAPALDDPTDPITGDGAPDDDPDLDLDNDPDLFEVEIVDGGGALPVKQSGAHAAIEAAAHAAMAEPDLPGRDEFMAMAMMARIIAGSDLAPKSIRGKPADAFVMLLTARDLGIPLTAAMRKVYVIDGQPSIAPQLECALIRRLGLGAVVPWERNHEVTDYAGAVAIGPDGVPMGPPVFFTWDDAKVAQLVATECAPGVHSTDCKKNQQNRDMKPGPFKCKHNWITYPRDDMWWRAAGRCARMYFPEAALGIYSPDELGAITDDMGRPIDPATIELPPGFEQAERKTGAAARASREATGDVEKGDADELADLVLRARVLPEEQQTAFKVKFRESERLRAFTLSTLPADRVRLAASMLKGFERMAERTGWNAETAKAEHLAAHPPETAPQTPGAPEPAPEVEGGATEPEPTGKPGDGHTDPDPVPEGDDQAEGS